MSRLRELMEEKQWSSIIDTPNPGINEFGTKRWYQNGLLHRVGDPAIEYLSGSKMWFHEGGRHRLDGPAVVYSDGRIEYWVEGNKAKSKNL